MLYESQNDEGTAPNHDTKYYDWRYQLAGMVLSVSSGIFWMGTDIIFKKMELDVGDSVFVISLVQVVIFAIIIKGKGQPLWIWSVDENKSIHKIRILQLGQGFVAGILIIFYLISIMMMDIGDALTCYFSAFLPTMILSRIFLKEKIGIYKICCGIITIAGIILILKLPETNNHKGKNVGFHAGTWNSTNDMTSKVEDQNNYGYTNAWFGPSSAIISMVSLSVVFVISTFLYKNESTKSVEMTVLYNGLGQLLVSVIAPIFGGRSRLFYPSGQETPYDTWNWICFCIIATTSIAAIFTRFLALKYIGPTTGSFVRTVDIVLAYFAQIIFFHAIPNSLSILGAFFILFVCIVIPFEKTFVSFIPEKLQHFF